MPRPTKPDKDLYEVLGVSKGADAETLKKAYRKKVKSSHPDTTGGDGTHFRALTLAYEVLTDDQQRDKYDKTGQVGGGQVKDVAFVEALKLVMAITEQLEDGQNILVEALNHCEITRQQVRKEIAIHIERAAKFRSRASRFKRKDDKPNYFSMAMDNHAAQLEESAERLKQRIEMLDMIEALLNEYQYDPENMEIDNNTMLINAQLFFRRP